MVTASDLLLSQVLVTGRLIMLLKAGKLTGSGWLSYNHTKGDLVRKPLALWFSEVMETLMTKDQSSYSEKLALRERVKS